MLKDIVFREMLSDILFFQDVSAKANQHVEVTSDHPLEGDELLGQHKY